MASDTTILTSSTGPDGRTPRRCTISRGLLNAGVLIAVFAVGAVGGAVADHRLQKHHPHAVLLLQPAPIAKMADSNPVAIKGQVTEIFGNKFILQDDSGHTLVDTGPRGEGGKPIAPGETITVQGHFAHGFIHADVMTRADGTSEEFGPGRHPHPEHGPGRQPPPPRS